MSKVSTGAGLPCVSCGAKANEPCSWKVPLHDRTVGSDSTTSTTPEPAGDLVERVARAMMAASRPNANPDDPTPAPRGTIGFVPKWRLFEHLARAAIAAMPDRTALVGNGTAVAYNNGYKHAAEKFGAEITTFRLLNDLLEQFRKSDLEELATLRTQLVASQADVARLREALRACRRAVGGGADEPRRNVREIVDLTLEPKP